MFLVQLVFASIEMIVFDVGTDCLEQVREPFPMLGADRDRIAEAETIGLKNGRLGGPAFGLVRDEHDGSGLRAKPAANLFIERSDARAPVDQEQRGVGIAHCRFGLRPHASGQRVRVLIFETCGIDHPELEAKQIRVTLAAIACHARPVIDQRLALADEPVDLPTLGRPTMATVGRGMAVD